MTARRRLFLRPLECRLAPATLSGIAFGDYDSNGVKSANERGEVNVAVRLDLDGDGTFDASANTAADGSYSFTGVPDGTHKVAVTLPTGFTATSAASISVGVAGGADISKLNFALKPTGSINGTAFRDDNFNGILDTSEVALSGVTIGIDYFGDGSTDASATTDASGKYTITGAPDGSHKFVAALTGSTRTNENLAGVILTAGGTAMANPGFVPSAVVSGFVYVDQNLNGKFDSGEKLAVGSQVALDLNNDGINDKTIVTDSNGQFHFTGVADGSHAVVIPTLPATPMRRSATVTGGTDVTGLAFGLTSSGKLTGTVFADINGNGVKDTNEVGLSGASVALDFYANNSADETVTTGSDGSYTFTDIPDGTHMISVSRTGFSKTTSNPVSLHYDAGMYIPVPPPPLAYVPPETRVPGVDYGYTAPDPTRFGLAPSAVVSGFVYADVNNNLGPDAGEKELANVAVNLDLNGDGTVDMTTTTNANGRYYFAGVPNGEHKILATAPAGFELEVSQSIIVTGGTDRTGLGLALRPLGSVSGTVFNDANDNGVRESSEAVVANTPVLLLVGNDVVVASTTTDANGRYTFTSVAEGDYTVNVVPPTGYAIAAKTQPQQAAFLSESQSLTGINFGLKAITNPAVIGVVFYDANNNGLRDTNEPLVSGINVHLTYDPNGGGAATQAFPGTTGADGIFRINPVVSSKYLLYVDPPTGYAVTTTQGQSVTYAGANITGFNLGIRPTSLSPSAITTLLTGTVYRDDNGNSMQDGGESNLLGVPVTITLSGNGATLVTTTDATGKYNFTGLPDGTHTLSVNALTKSVTSSVLIGSTATVTKSVGVVPPRSIAITLYFDTNGNGVQDSGELVATNVGVTLDLESDGLITSTDGTVDLTATTNASGVATFTSVPDGNHLVKLTANGAVLTGGAFPFNLLDGVATPPAVTLGYRFTPTKVIAVSNDSSTVNSVVLLDSSGRQITTFAPFGVPSGARIATGDVNGDGTEDYAVGSGGTTGPTFIAVPSTVRVIDGKSGAELFTIVPFGSSFFGGLFVALGDLNNDGRADLVITPDLTGGPRVRIFNGNGFVQIADFFGIDDVNFRGGARAAVGDVNGDGRGDLVVSAGTGGGPRVAVYDGSKLATTGGPKLVGDFFVFDEALRNGAFLAVGDVNGDGFADIVAGAGPGGGPRVTTFSGKALMNGTQTKLTDFFAGGQIGDRSGVKVAVADVDNDGKADIVTGYRTVTTRQARVATYLSSAATASGTPLSVFDVEPFPGAIGAIYVG